MADDSEALRRRIAELTAEIRLLRQQFEAEVGRSTVSGRPDDAVIVDAAPPSRRKGPPGKKARPSTTRRRDV
jgi:hypothetical protein